MASTYRLYVAKTIYGVIFSYTTSVRGFIAPLNVSLHQGAARSLPGIHRQRPKSLMVPAKRSRLAARLFASFP